MPIIQKAYSVEVTPQQFINSCSDLELQELDLLLSQKLQQRTDINDIEVVDPVLVETNQGHNADFSKCGHCDKYIK